MTNVFAEGFEKKEEVGQKEGFKIPLAFDSENGNIVNAFIHELQFETLQNNFECVILYNEKYDVDLEAIRNDEKYDAAFWDVTMRDYYQLDFEINFTI